MASIEVFIAALKALLPALSRDVLEQLAQILASAGTNTRGETARVRLSEPRIAAALHALAGQTLVVDGEYLSVEQRLAILGDVGTVQLVTVEPTGVIQGDVIGTKIEIVLPVGAPALHQLRAPVADFVGREEDVRQLVRSLSRGGAERTALISGVQGMGGLGKTELAYAVAQQLASLYPDAQIVLSLRGASQEPMTPEQALAHVLTSFEPGTQTTQDIGQLQARYRAQLAGKRVLILADDARDAAQVRALLPPPGSALLITSRTRFLLPGMTTADLSVLPPDKAEALLRHICPRIGDHASELTRLCGGLPLALRVSASLLQSSPALSVERYITLLRDERLLHLADPDTPDDPQASVAASILLSFESLPPAAQEALCQLSVFRAPFDADAAQAVMQIDGNSEAAINLLNRRSLLDWDAGTKRFGLHDLVREFGITRFHDEGVFERHAKHYLSVLQEANTQYRQGGEASLDGLARFDRDRPNIEQGWRWAIERVKAGASRDGDELFVGYQFAIRSMYRRRYVDSFTLSSLELRAARRIGNRYSESIALTELAEYYTDREEYERAVALFEKSLAVARAVNYRLGEGIAGGKLALLYKRQGNYERAVKLMLQSLAIIRERPGDRRNRRSEVAQMLELSGMYRAMGDDARSLTILEEVLALARSIGHHYGEARALDVLGDGYAKVGDYRRAAQYYEQALAVASVLKDYEQVVQIYISLANAHLHLGQHALVVKYCEKALDIARTNGGPGLVAYASWSLGRAFEEVGDLARALPLLEASVSHQQQIDHPGAAENAAHLEQLRARLSEQQADGS